MQDLETEQFINERSPIRVIGLTIETRPDYVSLVDRKNRDIQKKENQLKLLSLIKTAKDLMKK